ncbi:sugar phosphate isomerase/epimerase [Parabacteroides sp. OttesenSCG-928-G21]|nr:sugar phosphate isomerase/epimerase [Parabacteroides sp. OttesenSCG-928-G21]
MNRRHFIQQSSVAIAATALAGYPAYTGNAKNSPGISITNQKKKIGLQLYSLKDDLSKDVDGTLKAIANIGYTSIEPWGYRDGKFFGKTPLDFKNQLADLGMKITSSHTGFGVYQTDTTESWDAVKKNMEDHRITGTKWIIQASYPGTRFTTLDEVKKLADTLNRIGELAKSFGLKFAYHNHTEEFRTIERQIPYQKYLELTDKTLVFFQMDIGHVANAMCDYVGYLLAYPGRFANLHIRDTDVITKKATEYGKGNVRFKEVFDLFDHAGVEDYYVEQEGYDFEPIVSVKNCYDYLTAADYVKW